ncbi:DUF4241 domain-containing protein [Frigoriglobus tundricola]|uniref:Uncharacterized protein n=1 Tax=Frigoriglobus tundricola TaxID=2774151 RepID=A0A6M5YK50_9BACT|nr:DUF4241 domain-containing protein [Frigoriglobus tundricola]QJW93681.1 hypothetical protein FTUN_1189 [Frigoriglobus tundricola]
MARRWVFVALGLVTSVVPPARGEEPTRQKRLDQLVAGFREAKNALPTDAADEGVAKKAEEALKNLEKKTSQALEALVAEKAADDVSFDAVWFALSEVDGFSHEWLERLLNRIDNPKLIGRLQAPDSPLGPWNVEKIYPATAGKPTLRIVCGTLLADLVRFRKPAETADLADELLADPASQRVPFRGRPAADHLRALRFLVRNLQPERPFPEVNWTTVTGKTFRPRKGNAGALYVAFLTNTDECEKWAKAILKWAAGPKTQGLEVVLIADFEAARYKKLALDFKLAENERVVRVPATQPDQTAPLGRQWAMSERGDGMLVDSFGTIRDGVSPRYPEFDQAGGLLAEAAEYKNDPKRPRIAFGFDGHRQPDLAGYEDVLGQTSRSVFVQRVPDLPVTSGQLSGFDGYAVTGDEPTFAMRVPLGTYPLRLAVRKYRTGDQRVAFARIGFSSEPVARWELARFAPQKGEEEGQSGYGVDSGFGGFADADFLAELRASPGTGERFRARAQKGIDNTYRYTRSWHEGRIGSTQMVAFHSGLGDGRYRSYWGYDKNNKLAALMTDLDIVQWAKPK